jgi:hypothetical protein
LQSGPTVPGFRYTAGKEDLRGFFEGMTRLFVSGVLVEILGSIFWRVDYPRKSRNIGEAKRFVESYGLFERVKVVHS